MQDLMSGQIQMAFLNPATAAPHVRSGVIKALGVTSGQRLKILADVPTTAKSRSSAPREFVVPTSLDSRIYDLDMAAEVVFSSCPRTVESGPDVV
jgi:tripartite-type tricarboxylate transporter receptor subunit TctC